jgi:hypothetical protein
MVEGRKVSTKAIESIQMSPGKPHDCGPIAELFTLADARSAITNLTTCFGDCTAKTRSNTEKRQFVPGDRRGKREREFGTQNYLYFMGQRNFFQQLAISYCNKIKSNDFLQDIDLVIHLRASVVAGSTGLWPSCIVGCQYRVSRIFFPVICICILGPPPAIFFLAVIKRHRLRHPNGSIYLITAVTTHPIAAELQNEAGIIMLKGRTAAEDMSLLIKAKYLAISFGTFSWVGAFLSNAKEVHFPYFGTELERSFWLPWPALFVHDDVSMCYL